MKVKPVPIGQSEVGPDLPVYIVAELSANHGGSKARAMDIMKMAADAGANAVKLQTYRADTMTIDCSNEHYTIRDGLWAGYTLYELYEEAHTPWAWHEDLFSEADRLGIDCFSTPFDASAVEFLEQFNPPCYKLASFELLDLELIDRIAATRRPVIFSTGMSRLADIELAINRFRSGGSHDLIGLRCISAYPADPRDFNLQTIPHMETTFGLPWGLSDHSPGHAVAVAGVALGARLVEKHLTGLRSDGGPDAAFSMEPAEFAELVKAVRIAESATGNVAFGCNMSEATNVRFRRSICAISDIESGTPLTYDNIRVIRPGYGLPPADLERVLGRAAAVHIARGTPLNWQMIGAPCG